MFNKSPSFVDVDVEFCIKNDGFCIKNDEFCIKNDGFCIKNDGVCIKNDDFQDDCRRLPDGLDKVHNTEAFYNKYECIS